MHTLAFVIGHRIGRCQEGDVARVAGFIAVPADSAIHGGGDTWRR